MGGEDRRRGRGREKKGGGEIRARKMETKIGQVNSKEEKVQKERKGEQGIIVGGG